MMLPGPDPPISTAGMASTVSVSTIMCCDDTPAPSELFFPLEPAPPAPLTVAADVELCLLIGGARAVLLDRLALVLLLLVTLLLLLLFSLPLSFAAVLFSRGVLRASSADASPPATTAGRPPASRPSRRRSMAPSLDAPGLSWTVSSIVGGATGAAPRGVRVPVGVGVVRRSSVSLSVEVGVAAVVDAPLLLSSVPGCGDGVARWREISGGGLASAGELLLLVLAPVVAVRSGGGRMGL